MTIYRDLKCHQITFEDFIFFFVQTCRISRFLLTQRVMSYLSFWNLDREAMRSARFTTLITFHTHLLLLNRMINHNRITTNLKRVIDKVAFLSLLHGAFNPEVHKPEGMSNF